MGLINSIGAFFKISSEGFTFGSQADKLTVTGSIELQAATTPYLVTFPDKNITVAGLDDIPPITGSLITTASAALNVITFTKGDSSTFNVTINTGSAGGSGTVTSIGGQGTVNGLTLTGTVTTSGSLTLGGTLAISNNDWSGTDLSVANGGTGASTLTGAVIGNGASAMTAVAGTALQYLRRNSGNTAYEFATGAALSRTNDTNVTLTLGGTPTTSLLAATSMTLGWTGQLAVGRGGTGASTLTGVVIGDGASAMTAVAGTASQLLRRNAGNTAYEFFTPTYTSCLGTVTSVGTSAPLTGGTITTTGTIGITQATTSTDGYLSSTDWNTFNSKTTCVGTVTSVTAGDGMTQTGTSTVNPTLNIVSNAGSAGTIGTINIAADSIGVNLGTTSTTAAAGNHAHGSITNAGAISATTALASGDWLVFSDASNSSLLKKSSITIGASTTTYLRNDGTWSGIASITGSSLVTASAALNVLTFTKGDSTTFNVTIDTGSGGGGGVTGTGTTNYIPKWTSATAIGDSSIHTSGTNIGIGRTASSVALIVSGANHIGNNDGWVTGLLVLEQKNGTKMFLDGNDIDVSGSSASDLFLQDYSKGSVCMGGNVFGAKNLTIGRLHNNTGFSSSIAGGTSGSIASNNAFIGGGNCNSIGVSGNCAFIGGGCKNSVTAIYGVIAGGISNLVSNSYNFIGGGALNTASIGTYSVVAGGNCNHSAATYSVIGGGWRNCVVAGNSTIAGGLLNCICQSNGAILGGCCNRIVVGSYSTLGGGYNNIINGCSTGVNTIAGGQANCISGSTNQYSTIGGGITNEIYGCRGTIAGGYNNTLCAYNGAIGGGTGNSILSLGFWDTIGGGAGNQITGQGSTISGGYGNRAAGGSSFVGGGCKNCAAGNHSVVAGGTLNTGSAACSFIGGGNCNYIAIGSGSSIVSGYLNCINGGTLGLNSIVGGCENTMITSARCSFIGGGSRNQISGSLAYGSSILGGYFNRVCGCYSTILGGCNNISTGTFSVSAGVNSCTANSYPTAIGGFNNRAIGSYSVVVGGLSNHACSQGGAIGGGANNCIFAGNYNTVGGGTGNKVCDCGCITIAGGFNNSVVTGIFSTIGGGTGNKIDGCVVSGRNTIAGGDGNTITGSSTCNSTIGGGRLHVICGGTNTISGGSTLCIWGVNNTISGGSGNCIWNNGNYNTVAGGAGNDITGSVSNGGTLSGGYQNCIAAGGHGTIGGGCKNCITTAFATIGGGLRNTGSGACVSIGGGSDNSVTIGIYSTVGGGQLNKILSSYTTIAGGCLNYAQGQSSFVGGGQGNCTSGFLSAIVGGCAHVMDGVACCAFIGGGCANRVCSIASNVLGGVSNCALPLSCYSSIAGGSGNYTNACYSFMGGGTGNAICNSAHAVILGGCLNFICTLPNSHATDNYNNILGGNANQILGGEVGFSTVINGCKNLITGSYGVIGGGCRNRISSNYSVIGGGLLNSASGACSGIFGGSNNVVTHACSYIVGDNLTSTAACYLFANNICNVGGGTSDCRLKENIHEIPYGLCEVTQLEPVQFNFIDDESKRTKYGFLAQCVMEIMPELIYYHPTQTIGGDKVLQFDKEAIWASLVNAVKDQQKQINTLREEVDLLKKQKGSL